MEKSYQALVKRAALAATLLSTGLLLLKIFSWWITGSITLLAALVDSVVDIAASLTNLLIIRYAMQPADREHRFGHGKAESLAALAQSMFVCGSALFLGLSSIQRLIEPQPLQDALLGVVVAVITLGATSGLILYQHYVITRTHSQAIKADMMHYQADLWVNGAVILALALSHFGYHWADGVVALLISIIITYTAIKMCYAAVQALLDRTLPIEVTEKIIRLIKEKNPQIRGVHDLRTRQAGPTRFIQLHLEMADDLPLATAHAYSDEVEVLLSEHFPGAEIFIHQDPSMAVTEEKRGRFSV